jgi:hypothetical protein
MYCHVSAQIDQHLADVDRMDAREEAINGHAHDILDEMLSGDSPIDEDVATFFEESGEIFELLKAAFVEDKECSSREDRKERLMRKMEDLWDKELVEIAEEEAEKRLD